MKPSFSIFSFALLLVFCGLAAFCSSCSKNNIGDLFQNGYVQGNPQESGFGEPDANGAYTLHGLEAGTVFGEGGPEVAAVFPADGSTGVSVDALVILRFTQSLSSDAALLAAAVTLVKADGSGTVAGAASFVEGSAHRLVVFTPAGPLEDETEYNVTLSAGLVVDAQGEALTETGKVAGFTTGRAGDDVSFAVLEDLILPAKGAVRVLERAPVIVFFTEAVDETSATAGLTVKDERNVAVGGDVSFPAGYGDRLLVFEPSADMPAGKRIDVTLKKTIENAGGSEQLKGQIDFSFTVIGFPRVTGIALEAGDPLVALPANIYAGRVVSSNEHAVKATVTLAGSGRSDRLVLIFWDNVDKAIVIVDEASRKAGKVTYTVDLKPEMNEAIADGTISVGAFTSDSNGNSAVGPAAGLPALLKDIVAPSLISLGPPHGTSPGQGELLLEVPDSGIFGRASEDLSGLTVTVDVDGTAQTLQGITFFSMEYPNGSGIYSREATRGTDNLFITESLTGIDPATAARAAPFKVTRIAMTDLAGNETVLDDPADTSVDFRGYVHTLSAASHELEVFCYDAVTLLPVENADVLVDQHSRNYAQQSADRLGGHTGADGRAVFDNVSVLLPEDFITVTAVKDGYVLTSLLGLDKPVPGGGVLVSMPLSPESGSTAYVTSYPVSSDGSDLPEVYIGGNLLVTGTDALFYDAGENPTDPENPPIVTTARGGLKFLEGLGVTSSTPEDLYQWAWSNPFLAETGASLQTLLFLDVPKDVNDLTVQEIETENLSPGYDGRVEAHLVALLAGFKGTLPLALDRAGAAAGGGEETFTVPMPPSLFVNEVIGEEIEESAFDPPYELVIEPALGPASYTAEPDQALLEGALRFEVEEAENVPDPKIIIKRIPYEQAGLGTTRTVSFPEQGGSPVEMWALFVPTVYHPLEVYWNPALTLFGAEGVYVLHYATSSGSRHWTAYVPAGAHTDAGDLVRFPDLSVSSLPAGFAALNDFTDFNTKGDYTFRAEAYALSSCDLNEAFLSAVERDFDTYLRSDLVTGTLEGR